MFSRFGSVSSRYKSSCPFDTPPALLKGGLHGWIQKGGEGLQPQPLWPRGACAVCSLPSLAHQCNSYQNSMLAGSTLSTQRTSATTAHLFFPPKFNNRGKKEHSTQPLASKAWKQGLWTYLILNIPIWEGHIHVNRPLKHDQSPSHFKQMRKCPHKI